MLRKLLHRQLDAAERRLGAPVDYLRYILDHDRRAFLKIGLFQPTTTHRRTLPPEVLHAAKIATTQCADCGTCVQIEVKAAREAGVATETIRAILHGETDDLAPEVRDAIAFAEAVVAGDDPTEIRARMLERYSDAGLIELALAVTTAQVYPTLKRSLGYATACSLVTVEV